MSSQMAAAHGRSKGATSFYGCAQAGCEPGVHQLVAQLDFHPENREK